MGGPELTRRDPNPIQGTQHAYLGVLDHIQGSGLCVQGSDASSWRSGPTDCTLGYIIFSGHVAPLEPSTWWGRVLFTVRLEIAARAPCHHTVVRGTPDSGYRQQAFGILLSLERRYLMWGTKATTQTRSPKLGTLTPKPQLYSSPPCVERSTIRCKD
jgi:hypothetical protein